jgi:hypothetical protein
MPTKREVVDEIPGTGSVIGMNLWLTGQAGTFQLVHLRKKKIQTLNQFLELCRIAVLDCEGGLLGHRTVDIVTCGCC